MSFIDSNLMHDEHVQSRARLHWIVFLWPAIWLVLALALLSSGDDSAIAGGALVFILALATGLASFINVKTSEFAVTNKRVLMKTGFIRRKSFEVLLSKVEGIQVDQGVLGRIIGYGTIVVTGTGGSADPFPRIAAPLNFRRHVQEQVASTQDKK
jgi:uncharacterized membrane protein YdbT with pleckstrin-like domain